MARARLAAALVAFVLGCVATGCSAPSAPTLAVDPAAALLDAPVRTTVSGVDPGSEVALRLVATGDDGSEWRSSGTVRADDDGVAHPDVMRLVDRLTTGEDGDYLDPTAGFRLTLTARVGDGPATSVRLTRRPPEVTTRDLTLADDGVLARLYLPAHTGETGAAVVALGGSEGGLSPTLQASMLAAHGHPAMALAYFGAPGLPQDLAGVPLAYVARAARLLARAPGADPRRVVLWGVSRGSEPALLTAARYPRLVHGVVATVPAALVGGGLPDRSRAAWSYRGEPIAPAGDEVFDPDPDPGSPYALPVERVDGPVLLVCGGEDETWYSCPDADALVARSARLGGPTPTVLRYPDAGHYVGGMVPYVPTTETGGTTAAGRTVRSGGSTVANQDARADAWPRLLAWLDAVPR